MDVKTAPDSALAPRDIKPGHGRPSAGGWTLLLFVIFWGIFYALFQAFPYLKNGSDVVFSAKLRLETKGTVFPPESTSTRVLIFGNSKILAGFLPSLFDRLGLTDGRKVTSFNSGFPGSDLYLAPLEQLCARDQAPGVLLLTLPWSADPPRRGLFHFILDDHAMVDELFPFRSGLRDLTAFMLAANSHGGVSSYYREAQATESAVVAERGYYFIAEQSRFPDGRLPADFHLSTDEPTKLALRTTPAVSSQPGRLHQLIRQHHIDCYYVPEYLREGEAAPAAPVDQPFADAAARETGCKVIGPDYFLYPNRLFSDQTHLNGEGARVYTSDLYQLLKENARAFQ